MRKMIDADKLLELFEQDDDVFKSQDIRHIICKIPTADVVEVVRCCDCKHWTYDVPTGERICNIFWFTAKDCDYCSHAERREDEQIY